MDKNFKLIILPGWKQNSDHWQEVVKALENTISTEVIDLPGFGKTSYDSTLQTVNDYADSLKNKLKQYSFQSKLILLGHSFGGKLAVSLVSQNEFPIQALVLYAAPCLYRPSLQIKTKIKLVQTLKKITPSFLQNSKLTSKFRSDDYQNIKNSEMETLFKNSISLDQASELQKINLSTYLLWGENDMEVRLEIGQEMQKLISTSKLIVSSKVGHNFHLENPNLFIGKLKQIITEIQNEK